LLKFINPLAPTKLWGNGKMGLTREYIAYLKRTRVCPRCGRLFSYLEERVDKRSGKTYYYAVHYLGYERQGGRVKKKIQRCYLGPEYYDYATRTHLKEGLVFKGLVDSTRLLDYLEVIVGYLETAELSSDTMALVISRLERLTERLKARFKK